MAKPVTLRQVAREAQVSPAAISRYPMARSNSCNPRARESIAQFASLAILNGSPPPDSRLGIIETAARCGVRPTPLRDALSWLAPRGSSAIGKQGFGESASRQDLAEIVRIRTVVEREALRLSTAP
jgi:DNA-binding GntR family transcriptional regulator